MEHSTSAVNWQPRNVAKQPGQMRRNSLAARRARRRRRCCFFQWRASQRRRGEVPLRHGAARRRRHQGLARGGRSSAAPAGARRGRRQPGAAPTSRCCSTGAPGGRSSSTRTRPSTSSTWPIVRDYHGALWKARRHRRLRRPDDDLSGVPARPRPRLVPRHRRKRPRRSPTTCEAGGHLLCHLSSAASSTRTTRSGSAATPARSATCSACGSRSSSRFAEGDVVRVSDDGAERRRCGREALHAEGAEVTATYLDGPLAGRPAITAPSRSATASGATSRPGSTTALAKLIARCLRGSGRAPRAIIAAAGSRPCAGGATNASYLFVINHTQQEADVPVGRRGAARPPPRSRTRCGCRRAASPSSEKCRDAARQS